MESETAQWKKLNYFTLFVGDDIKRSDLELYFCIVVQYKCFCKKLLALPWIFPVRQSAQCVFHLVQQFFISVRYWTMSDPYFKAWKELKSIHLMVFGKKYFSGYPRTLAF